MKKSDSGNSANQVKRSTGSHKGASKSKSLYKQTYREIEVIGKGTSGQATLVRHIVERKYYVSKKIRLAHLQEKDKQKASLELKLLKELKHPHIVEFKESFSDQDTLIIIMEYCEDGDLGFHIKRKLEKNEQFSEETILNWFTQIAMALNFIHSKKVLHRDIKASNIFISQCGTVKIGDFGISKQLDSTIDKAQTLIGTPYYLSPEVCENKPYTFSSDIWSLGCLLYEMCSLKHPFVSSNLMTLVFKIIKDDVENLDKCYSPELNMFTKLLLEKDQSKRPTTSEILCTNMIMKVMNNFIQKKGASGEQVPIKKLNIHMQKEQQHQHRNPSPKQQSENKPNTSSQQKGTNKKSNYIEMEKKVQSQLNKLQQEAKFGRAEVLKEKERQQQQKQQNLMQKHKPKTDFEKQDEKMQQLLQKYGK